MQILDLIAKVSWETNAKDLKTLSTELNNQDKAIDELNRKGKRLADQMVKTNDPKKVKALNDELNRTKKSVENIVASQQKQVTVVEQLRKKQQEFYKELSKANDPKATQGLLRGLKDIEKQLGVLEKKSSDLPKKMSGIGQSLLSGFGLGAGMFGAQAIAATLKSLTIDSIEGAADLGETMTKVEAIFGDSTNTISEWAGSAAKSIGQSKQTALDATATFGIFGKSAKLTGEELANFAITMTKLSSDLASFYNTSPEQAINAIGAALRGESEPMRSYGVLLDDATLKLQALEDGLITTTKDALTPQQKVLAAYQVILKQTELAQGDFQRTSKGAANQQRILRAEVENLQASLGDKLLPVYSDLLTVLNQLVSGDISSAIIKLSDYAREIYPFLDLVQSLSERVSNFYNRGEVQKGATDEIRKFYQDMFAIDAAKKKALDSSEKTPEQIAAEEEAKKEAEKAKKAAEAAEKQRKKNAAKLIEDLKQIDRDLAAAQLSADEKEINAVEEKYRKLLELAKQFGVDSKEVETRKAAEIAALVQKQHERDLKEYYEYGQRKIREEYEGEIKARQDAADRQAKLDAIDDADTAARVKKAFKDKDELTAEQNRLDDERMQANQELMANTNQLASVVSGAMQTEISGIDRLIQAQQERVQVAMQSGNKSVEIEEKRLSELLKKREQYEKAQRLIDNTMIVANNAVAVSNSIRAITDGAVKGGPIGVAAQGVAIAAGIATIVLALRDSFRAGEGFKDGGYTGDGDPSETSTALGKRGYKYHKKEFVMNEPLTAKHRDMFEKLHTGQLDVKRIGGAYFLAPQTLDVDAAVSDHNKVRLAMNLTGVENTLRSIDSRLQAREVNVVNTFDAEGFSTKIAAQLGQIHIKNKLANS